MRLVLVVHNVLQLNAEFLRDLGEVGLIEDARDAGNLLNMGLFLDVAVVDEIDGDCNRQAASQFLSGEV